jgi:prevent-host-death family protein
MTTVSIEEFRAHPDVYLTQTEKGDVVLTQNGEPWVVLRSVAEDQDRLSSVYANSPEFRHLIEQRRQEPSIPWQTAKEQLGLDV